MRTTLKNGTKHDVSGSLRFQFKLHLADMYRRCSQGNNGALSRPQRGYSCNNEVTCTLHTDLRIPTTRSTITKETEHVRHLLQALSLPLLFAHVHTTQFCTCFTLGAVHEGTPGKNFRVFGHLLPREEILPRRESSKMKISRGRGREGELVQSQSDFHFATNSAWQKSFPACNPPTLQTYHRQRASDYNLREVARFLPRDAGLAWSHVPTAPLVKGAVPGEGVEGEPLAVGVILALLQAAVARVGGDRLDDTCVILEAACSHYLQSL